MNTPPIFYALDNEESCFNVTTAGSVESEMSLAKDQVFSQLYLFAKVPTFDIKLAFSLVLLWWLVKTCDLFRIYYFRRPVSTYCKPYSSTPKLKSNNQNPAQRLSCQPFLLLWKMAYKSSWHYGHSQSGLASVFKGP
jgi:hypothetical protein